MKKLALLFLLLSTSVFAQGWGMLSMRIGEVISLATSQSVLYAFTSNGAVRLAQDNANFYYDPSTTTLHVPNCTGCAGGGTTYTAGNGLTLTGTVFSLSQIYVGTKTLTESSATNTVNIALASNSAITGKYIAGTYAADGTPHNQSLVESVDFDAQNTGGTATCNLGPLTASGITDTGTLTDTVTCVISGNNILIAQNAVSSLTQTTLQSSYTVILNGTNVITGQ